MGKLVAFEFLERLWLTTKATGAFLKQSLTQQLKIGQTMARYTVGKYRIYSTDLLNWQIEEFTTAEHHLAKSAERWKHHERYCQKLEHAFAYVLECMLKDSDIDIETAEQFKELTENLKAEVAKSLEGVEK